MSFWTNSLNFANLTSKSVPVGADTILIGDSAASPANKPSQATISNILAHNNNYLGQLNAGNSFANTTILSGYHAYQILMNPGNAIMATGSNQIEIGFQYYISGSYITTGYTSFSYGINGENESVVSVDGAADCSIIFPAFTTAPSLYYFNGILSNIAGQQTMQWSAFPNDANAGITYSLNGTSILGNGTAASGLKLFFGGSGSLTGGSTAYFSIYGIPNS